MWCIIVSLITASTNTPSPSFGLFWKNGPQADFHQGQCFNHLLQRRYVVIYCSELFEWWNVPLCQHHMDAQMPYVAKSLIVRVILKLELFLNVMGFFIPPKFIQNIASRFLVIMPTEINWRGCNIINRYRDTFTNKDMVPCSMWKQYNYQQLINSLMFYLINSYM